MLVIPFGFHINIHYPARTGVKLVLPASPAGRVVAAIIYVIHVLQNPTKWSTLSANKVNVECSQRTLAQVTYDKSSDLRLKNTTGPREEL